MTDYNKLSDFEINKLVAERLAMSISENQGASLKAKSSSVLVNTVAGTFELNPCNNPSDAWPIIVDNRISVIHNYGWGACNFAGEEEIAMQCNPLRAAMIVFLMMNEVQK